MTEVKKSVSKPKPLTDKQKADIVEEYLGVHPRYFLYGGQTIRVDIFNHQRDGNDWRGWKPDEIAKGYKWLGN